MVADIVSPDSTLKEVDMIFRLTTKLAKKLHTALPKVLPAEANPFADWSAHLFTADRAQYILISNTASLYSMVMFGKGITDDCGFLDRATRNMGEVLREDGLTFFWEKFVSTGAARVSFSKAWSRSVTGSMNDLVFQAKFYLIERELSPFDVSFELNQTPMSYLNRAIPRDAFRNLFKMG